MNILFLINSLKSKSGSERVAIELANNLSGLECYSVTILNRDCTFNETAYPMSSEVNVIALDGSYFSFFKNTKKILRENNYDVVIVHNMGKLSLLLSLMKNIKKLVSLEHVSFISRPKNVQAISKILYKKIHQVITLTHSDKLEFDQFHTNVLVIPNFSPFKIKDKVNLNNKNILAIGRLTDQKNYLHLLKAWKGINNKIPDWNLNIYGEGEHKNLLNKFIEDNQLQNVILKGITSNIEKVYSESDFFVMSSKYEGLPMVLIEAQSFGLPVISYDCPCGPADVIQNNVNGYLIEDQNINELSAAMLNLCESPEILENFSRNSLLNAKRFQMDEIFKSWENQVLKG